VAKIVVLCEGDTEELALRYFIGRQWQADGLSRVGLKGIDLGGKPQDVGKYAMRYLGERETLAVFTLTDLQGTTLIQHKPSDDLERKVSRMREWLRAQIEDADSSRFFPHVCVHQTEAWILAEGHALATRLRDPALKPDIGAESKNFENPPSKRLNDLFRHRGRPGYHKIIDGRPLFEKMEFEPVYKSCHYFQGFYDDLKKAAGSPTTHSASRGKHRE
jgi:hypothetical protein